MTQGFQYQLVGTKHAPMLALSLYTLRRHHPEPIQIVCGDEDAYRAASNILEDDNYLAPISLVQWDAPKEGGKGQQHANKATAVRFSRFDKTIFLDADTTVHGNLSDLWPKKNEIVLTRFSDWVTTGFIMRGRLAAWLSTMPERVAQMQNTPYCAINTGVFAFSNECLDYLNKWKEVTDQNPIFMSDELAAQLLFIDFPHKILKDTYNFSPRYSTPSDAPIRVIHYHGMQHARPEKSKGWSIWMPLYLNCYQEDRCGVRNLYPDKHLRAWLNDNPRFLSHGIYGGVNNNG